MYKMVGFTEENSSRQGGVYRWNVRAVTPFGIFGDYFNNKGEQKELGIPREIFIGLEVSVGDQINMTITSEGEIVGLRKF